MAIEAVKKTIEEGLARKGMLALAKFSPQWQTWTVYVAGGYGAPNSVKYGVPDTVEGAQAYVDSCIDYLHPVESPVDKLRKFVYQYTGHHV